MVGLIITFDTSECQISHKTTHSNLYQITICDKLFKAFQNEQYLKK